MFTQKALQSGVVVLGCAALVFALGGCACCQAGVCKNEGGTISHAINKNLTKGFSLSEDQSLTQRDRMVYEAERYNDVYPEHKGTNGTYLKTSADSKQLWHWGI